MNGWWLWGMSTVLLTLNATRCTTCWGSLSRITLKRQRRDHCSLCPEGPTYCGGTLSLSPLASGQGQRPHPSPQIQGCPGKAENSPSIYDFVHSQEEPLHVLQQSSLFYIFPESPREDKTQPGCERDPRTWSELGEPQLDQCMYPLSTQTSE